MQARCSAEHILHSAHDPCSDTMRYHPLTCAAKDLLPFWLRRVSRAMHLAFEALLHQREAARADEGVNVPLHANTPQHCCNSAATATVHATRTVSMSTLHRLHKCFDTRRACTRWKRSSGMCKQLQPLPSSSLQSGRSACSCRHTAVDHLWASPCTEVDMSIQLTPDAS